MHFQLIGHIASTARQTRLFPAASASLPLDQSARWSVDMREHTGNIDVETRAPNQLCSEKARVIEIEPLEELHVEYGGRHTRAVSYGGSVGYSNLLPYIIVPKSSIRDRRINVMIDFNLFSHNNFFNQVISFRSILKTQGLRVCGCSVRTNSTRFMIS